MAPIRVRAVALALLFVLSNAPLAARAQSADACNVRVTLLQVNDVYRFTPADRGASGGLARVSALRKRVIKESPNTLFLLAGDTISPSVESITYKGRQMIDAWNQVGLDYSVFGNHEFDFGDEVLLERMKESNFKWLGANVVDAKTAKTFGATPLFDVREFGGVKVGIFGITLPETKTTSKPGADTVFGDPCETANRVIPQIRARGREHHRRAHAPLAQAGQAARALRRRDRRNHRRPRAHAARIVVGRHAHLQDDGRRAPTRAHRFEHRPEDRQGRVDRLGGHPR